MLLTHYQVASHITMTEESNTEQIINEYVDELVEQLEAVEQELKPLRKKKKQLILDAALKIAETGAVPYEYVSDFLCRHYKKVLEYVSEDYIRDILPSPVTKNKKKVSNVIVENQKLSTKINDNENKKVLEVNNTGRQESLKPAADIVFASDSTTTTEEEPPQQQSTILEERDILTLHLKPQREYRLAMNRLWNNERYTDILVDVRTNSVVGVRDGGNE